MKRFTLLLSFLMLIVSAPVPHARDGRTQPTVFAEETSFYAVADKRDVFFYETPDTSKGLFLIPYTYYVKVLEKGEPFSKVSYMNDVPPYRTLVGYCLTADITPVDFVPERPYLKKTVTVEYTLSNAVLVDDLSSVTVDYLLYGSYHVGSSLFLYVYGGGKFGYVPAKAEPEYELNVDYLATISSGEADEEEEAPKTVSPTEILFLVLLFICLLVGVVFLVRGRRSLFKEEDD